ncbi:MAG: chemotaxis protein CheW, partial [Bdellovibrionales bacterium]|nr:chemotaxis protein CheW [Bdellovibrionales bacterium]
MSSENDEIIQEFLVESFESLDQLDQDFLVLEENPEDKETINRIFRTIHTIKGTCGFLELGKLESVTHIGESLLDELRAGRIQLNEEIATSLLKMVDAVRNMLSNIEKCGHEGDDDFQALRETLTRLKDGRSVKEAVVTEDLSGEVSVKAQAEDQAHGEGVEGEVAEEFEAGVEPKEEPSEAQSEESELGDVANHDLIAEILASPEFADVDIKEATPPAQADVTVPDSVEELSVVAVADEAGDRESAIAQEVESQEEHSTAPVILAPQQEEAKEVVTPTQLEEEPQFEDVPEQCTAVAVEAKVDRAPAPKAETVRERSPAAESAGSQKPSVADSTLRVDVGLLDKVMNLVGELVLARNQILQFTKQESDAALINTCQRLNLITSELQEGVMKTRMQPIANVWNKFPRIVRDVARACGKEIRVEMEGKETELDKTILEAIKDPLTHIVRNSADHGIESPDVREGKGKGREGTLELRAYHEGGHVIIEISDDGAGLNVEKIRSKAVEKGIVTPEKAKRMSDAEIQRLIFHAGFSTADKITNVSGRGVGMDVVRSNIEKIGGSVDVQSQLNIGTTLKIKIPLTLAIVPALIISCREQRFAIPQVSLLELLRVENGVKSEELEEIRGSLFYRLRGNLLPLIDLQSELKMSVPGCQTGSEECGETELKALNIVVLRAENKDFGLIVETVHDTEEIVVKPLGRQVKDIEVFAGATIMGDGKVALILDVLGLGRKTSIVHESGERGGVGKELQQEDLGERQSLLLVRVGEQYRMAIPLSQVDRLEEFNVRDIERASGRSVVQYRGGILPLINLPEFFSQQSLQKDQQSVVVYSTGVRSVGLVVDEILDIVED